MPAAPPAFEKNVAATTPVGPRRQRWPQLTSIDVRFRGAFAYVTGQLLLEIVGIVS
jgi:hypothetical protein